jgi:amidase
MIVSDQVASWETTAKVSRDVLEQSIPKQWLLEPERLPAANVLNVLNIAEQSGILSAEEIEMTRQNIDGLLSNYKSGRWTVEAVTIAFLKRATISHQLVRY